MTGAPGRRGVAACVAALGLAATALLALPVLALASPTGAEDGAPVPGPTAVPGIPAGYVALFETWGTRDDVPWTVLAGIYRLECDFGQSPLPGCSGPGTENPAGAQGPGQWLPTSWRMGLVAHQIIPSGPPTASTADGYATDGDGDGVADPWDPADAVAATARLLAGDGASRGDLAGAIFAYNHDDAYVAQVLALASSYAAAGPASDGGSAPPAGAATAPVGSGVAEVLAFARSQLGDPYQWGGSGPDRWDCSGLVQAAYRTAGVSLVHDAAAQYAATAGHAVPLDELEPGDLVFYGTSAATIHHVGIAIDATRMIDAPYTGVDVRIDPVAASDLLAATRPLD